MIERNEGARVSPVVQEKGSLGEPHFGGTNAGVLEFAGPSRNDWSEGRRRWVHFWEQ